MKRILTYLFFIFMLLQQKEPYTFKEPEWIQVRYLDQNYTVPSGLFYGDIVKHLGIDDACHPMQSNVMVYHDLIIEKKESQWAFHELNLELLMQLKGVGPVLGQRLVEHLESIRLIEDFDDVKGIGPKLMQVIRLQVCF